MLGRRSTTTAVLLLVVAAVSCNSARRDRKILESGPSPQLVYEEIIIAGGKTSSRDVSSVETLQTTKTLPDLPGTTSGGTLTAMDQKLFYCGYVGGTSGCYTIDWTAASPQTWERYDYFLIYMTYYPGVRMGSHIWFLKGSTLYDLDTETGVYSEYQIPFMVEEHNCAVSNGGYSFVIGGSGGNEIWVNTEKYSPYLWKKINDLQFKLNASSCLLFENEIFITGGSKEENEAVSYNLVIDELKVAGSLNFGRYGHNMFVLDGQPAVAGGYSSTHGEFLDSIETYNSSSKTWTVDSRKLEQAREYAAVAQIVY